MILVVGASGMLGSRVAADLLAAGHKVRAGCRTTSKAAKLAAAGAEVVAIDLRDPGTIERALSGVEAVFTAVHGLMGRSRDSISEVDIEGQKRLIDAASCAGVQRYVHTSVQNADPESAVGFVRSKAVAEQHLMKSGLDYTILRPSAFADLYAHDLIGKSVLAGRTVWLLGSGETRRNMVAVADVSRVAVRALTEPGLGPRIIEIGGPDNVTEAEVAALYGRLSGKRVKLRRISPNTLRRIAAVAGPFHGGVRNLLTFIAELDGRSDLSFDAAAMPTLLGREPISLERFVRERLPS